MLPFVQCDPELEYFAGEKCPGPTLFLPGLWHTGIMATVVVFPILVTRAANPGGTGAAAFFVSISKPANGI